MPTLPHSAWPVLLAALWLAAAGGARADGFRLGPDPGPEGDPGLVDRVLVVKHERRLYLLREGRTVGEYPVRLGRNPFGHKQREGDFRTPEGEYRLVRRNPRSQFFLSIELSYPSEEDSRRAQVRGVPPGGLIMIHGQPNVPRKSPAYYAANDWTDGCIALSNPDMADIWGRTAIGTPIEIRP